MALKKSELYSSLWSSCDELRGGMDASQYKDYVLVLLFIKYVSDKYAGPYAPIKIPKGASFKDMVALKGRPDIGDQINKKIIAPLAKENKLSDFPDVVLKDIKNVHLSVHPPTGRVRISAPARMSLDTIRVFAISKLSWIRQQQKLLRKQKRETPREYVERESHYVWGKRYLLHVTEGVLSQSVTLTPRRMLLSVPRASDTGQRRAILDRWYRELVRESAVDLVQRWRPIVDVEVKQLFVQNMKTKWGSCNPRSKAIRLNTELAKKPKECLEYIVVHEMVHILEPTHNARFTALMDGFIPKWRHFRQTLNRIPVRHEDWAY